MGVIKENEFIYHFKLYMVMVIKGFMVIRVINYAQVITTLNFYFNLQGLFYRKLVAITTVDNCFGK